MKSSSRLDQDAPELLESTLPPTPVHLVVRWLKDAIARHDEEGDLLEPTALYLSTVAEDLQPHMRVVLMRMLDVNGPAWLSSAASTKAQDMAANPKVQASLVWFPLGRQIHFQGTAVRLPESTVNQMWAERTYPNQITFLSQQQSHPIASREEMDARWQAAAEQYPEGTQIERPADYVGWQLNVERIEFLSTRQHRMYDRIVMTNPGDFQLDEPGWRITRLQP